VHSLVIGMSSFQRIACPMFGESPSRVSTGELVRTATPAETRGNAIHVNRPAAV
jgi:hypothetical protein